MTSDAENMTFGRQYMRSEAHYGRCDRYATGSSTSTDTPELFAVVNTICEPVGAASSIDAATA